MLIDFDHATFLPAVKHKQLLKLPGIDKRKGKEISLRCMTKNVQ